MRIDETTRAFAKVFFGVDVEEDTSRSESVGTPNSCEPIMTPYT